MCLICSNDIPILQCGVLTITLHCIYGSYEHTQYWFQLHEARFGHLRRSCVVFSKLQVTTASVYFSSKLTCAVVLASSCSLLSLFSDWSVSFFILLSSSVVRFLSSTSISLMSCKNEATNIQIPLQCASLFVQMYII